MDKLTVAVTINALETAALEAWHNGNPSPIVSFIQRVSLILNPP